jgi:hypothetical protein
VLLRCDALELLVHLRSVLREEIDAVERLAERVVDYAVRHSDEADSGCVSDQAWRPGGTAELSAKESESEREALGDAAKNRGFVTRAVKRNRLDLATCGRGGVARFWDK